MKKNIIIFAFVLFVIAIIFTVFLFINNINKIKPMPKYENLTHIVVKGKIINSETEYIMIFTLNEKDEVINTREIQKYATREEAEQHYNDFIKTGMMTNLSISDNIVSFNNPSSNSISKERIFEITSSAEEIIEY